MVEPLEPRRAPASLANPATLRFLDVDGDRVTVAFSRPVLTPDNVGAVFQFDTGFGDADTGQQLQAIDLTGLPTGLSVTVTATKAGGGNGTADVGWVNATGKDVAAVRVTGDLGRVTAGDVNTRTPGLRTLAVGSLGARGLATQAAGGSLVTEIAGRLGKLRVAADVVGARVTVTGPEDRPQDGRIGSVAIGGDLRADADAPETGLITVTGRIGPVTIGGDVVGGAGEASGLRGARSIASVTIGGDVVGGAGAASAAIMVGVGDIGPVRVAGDIRGGAGDGSAAIYATGYVETRTTYPPYDPYGGYQQPRVTYRRTGGRIELVTVGGSILGGAGAASASVSIAGAGNLGTVRVAGDLAGGTGNGSASVRAESQTIEREGKRPKVFGGKIADVTVARAVTGVGRGSAAIHADRTIVSVRAGAVGGGAGDGSASVTAGTGIGSVAVTGFTSPGGTRVPGDLRGGAGIDSAAVVVELGNIGSVRIAGDLAGGPGAGSASVRVHGYVYGEVIYADPYGGGYGDPYGGGGGNSPRPRFIVHRFGGKIGAVTVGGSLAGGDGPDSASIQADGFGRVGPVQVGGDLTGGAGAGSGTVRAGGTAVEFPDLNPYDERPPRVRFYGGAVAAVTVGGSVTGGGLSADRVLGPVSVAGDWVAAPASAGGEWRGVITAIRVGGQVQGTPTDGDAFAFEADWIKGLSVDGRPIRLRAGRENDSDPIPLGDFGDFSAFELGGGL